MKLDTSLRKRSSIAHSLHACIRVTHSLTRSLYCSAPTEDLPVKVIELNPFDEYTDTALFKWKLHQRLMHEGPWTFRVVTEEEIHPPKKNWWRKVRVAVMLSACLCLCVCVSV